MDYNLAVYHNSRENSLVMDNLKELIADIRNKLQASLTVLELLSEGRDVSKEFIEAAKKDLDEAVLLLASVDNQKI
jgi:hypothetical protein